MKNGIVYGKKSFILPIRLNSNDQCSKSHRPRILLVEDAELIQKVYAVYFELLNCDTDVALDGLEALRLYPNGYDLILTDIWLPKIKGDELCQIIRSKGDNIPIIGVTACGEVVKNDCLRAGVTEFIVKPVYLKQLRNILEKYVLGYRAPHLGH